MNKLIILIILFVLASCSSTSNFHQGSRGTKICIDSLNNVEQNLYSAIVHEFPHEKFMKHRVFNGNIEERGYNVLYTFGADHQYYYLRYYPVKISSLSQENVKGFIIKGTSTGTCIGSGSDLESIIYNTYSKCSKVVEVTNFEQDFYMTYFKENLLADGNTWEIYSNLNDYLPFIKERGGILCSNIPKKIFGCSEIDDTQGFNVKCYVSCK